MKGKFMSTNSDGGWLLQDLGFGQEGKPDYIEEPLCKRAWCTLNPSVLNVHQMVWLGRLECECRPRYRPRYLIKVKNHENRPKTALALLQKGTLVS
ncbi:hypothetical protein AVEN_191386-1 [Araneus ventricosus]|uniref:Uncharacterized protein n=1 Tax=Araneus ventricosus TaxID=182803 RepID=A0A4Y2M9K6_ARAVE|nr:hypothetical protein AVEN_191386-1 [Araneus ventricosus]